MFKTRLISGIILVIIALATIIPGGPVLYVTLLAISLIGMQELYRAMKVREKNFNFLELAGYAGAVCYYLSLLKGGELPQMALMFALVLLMAVYVFTYPTYHADQIMSAMFGILYVAVMLSYIYKTRCLEGGGWLVGLILFKLLGKRYLCILRGNVDWKTQDGSCFKSEKISRRRSWWSNRRSPAWCNLCTGYLKLEWYVHSYASYVCLNLCSGRTDFHGRRFGCIGD